MKTRKRRSYWTNKRVLEVAKECGTRSEFAKKYPGAYVAASRNKWLKEATKHMTPAKTGLHRYWTKEKVLEAARECSNRAEFKKQYSGAWAAARKNDWLEEICPHLPTFIKPKGYWTKERVLESAQEYKTAREFMAKNSSAYTKATKQGWLKEIKYDRGEDS